MSANAVSNDNLKNYRDDQGTTGFSPKVTFAYDANAKEVDLTDETTYPSGVYLKKVLVSVHDKFGGEVRGTIVEKPGSGVDDDVTIDVDTLDASKGLDIKVAVLSTATSDARQLVANGIATNIGAAGELGGWDAHKNA